MAYSVDTVSRRLYTIYFMDENSNILTLNGQTIYNMYSSNYFIWVVDDKRKAKVQEIPK